MANKYETIFIINPDLGEEGTAALVTRFKELIEANGEIESIEEWGRRKLAYVIDYHEDGYYVKVVFTSKPDFPAELTRVYNITDGILRSLVVKMEA